jgi:hypothetical protein
MTGNEWKWRELGGWSMKVGCGTAARGPHAGTFHLALPTSHLALPTSHFPFPISRIAQARRAGPGPGPPRLARGSKAGRAHRRWATEADPGPRARGRGPVAPGIVRIAPTAETATIAHITIRRTNPSRVPRCPGAPVSPALRRGRALSLLAPIHIHPTIHTRGKCRCRCRRRSLIPSNHQSPVTTHQLRIPAHYSLLATHDSLFTNR